MTNEKAHSIELERNLEDVHVKDSTKTREINVLVRENKALKSELKKLINAISKASNVRDLTTLPCVDSSLGKAYLVGVRRGLIIAGNIAMEHAIKLGL